MKRHWIMLKLLFKKGGISRANYLRKNKILYGMGKHCYWHPFKIPSEPYLLRLHNNVVVASNVTFVTHDIIDYMLNEMDDSNKFKQFIGPIEIFDNVFIGNDSVILYNTKIGPNAIIASGSVVVDDVPEGAIVGGNPAKIIGSLDKLKEKRAKGDWLDKKEGIGNITNFYWHNSGK